MKVNILKAYSFHNQGHRDYQEDSRHPDSDEIDNSQSYFMVCDGVGGSAHGELASRGVCQSFAKLMARHHSDDSFSNSDLSELLSSAYRDLDSLSKKTDGDMATTLTFLCFHNEGCTMAHIGDSRIYQFRNGESIIYRSDDHSLVNILVHRGVISPSATEGHPQSHVITRCMEPFNESAERAQATVIRSSDIEAGDIFLLCSDGVLENIDDDGLCEIIISGKSLKEKAEELSAKCIDSSDNNTAILVEVESVNLSKDESIEEVDRNEKEEKEEQLNSKSTRRLPRQKSESCEVEVNTSNPGFFEKLKNLFKK